MPLAVCGALTVVSLLGVAASFGWVRAVALGIALVALGLAWGELRLDALERSLLASEIGESGPAQLVVTAPARHTRFAVRVPAETRSFRGRALEERVLLVLPVGRSPPRGAVVEGVVRVAEPRPASAGFDERAWLARQGIHVVLRASSWRAVGRRGGIPGAGDRLRDRIARAVGRGTDGVRRAIVLGIVLGEDEGLPDDVRQAFRASGLSHLLAVSGQNVAFLVGGVFGLGWLLRLSKGVCQVACLGVIAFLDDEGRALEEMRRILRPGGRLVLSFRSRYSLSIVLDAVAGGKRLARRLLGGGASPSKIRRFAPAKLIERTQALGFEVLDIAHFGYGPIRVNGKDLLPPGASIVASRWLTRLFGWRPLRGLQKTSDVWIVALRKS